MVTKLSIRSKLLIQPQFKNNHLLSYKLPVFLEQKTSVYIPIYLVFLMKYI